MSKQEIIGKLKDLLEKPALEVFKEVRTLEKEYKKLWTEEFEKAKQAFIDEGGKAKDFTYTKSKEDEEIAELLARFEKKKEVEEQKLESIREENKRQKQDLISQLEILAEADIQDITPIIKKLREIQSKWKEIKDLKKADYVELQRQYNLLLDKINENIKAFAQLQQYDLQKNTEQKEELLNKFEQLIHLDDIKKVEELFKAYKREWNQIGNVLSEKYSEIRTRFNDIQKKIKEKLDTYYAQLEEDKKRNLEAKNALIHQLKEIVEHLKDEQNIIWKDVNEKVQKIRSEWEKIGHIPFDVVKPIQDEYTALLDIYYDAKRKHQEYIQQKQNEIKKQKEKIIAELETLVQSKEFEKNTKRVFQLQQEWKKNYLRSKEESEQFNQKFKTLIDAFFENKKNYEKERVQEEKDNLVKKLDLIQKLKQTEFDKQRPEEVIQKIQEFIKEWNSIGYVPIEEKEKVNDEFFGKINQIYAELQLSDEKRHAIQYKSKLQQMLQSNSNPMDLLTKEEKFIKKKIAELENELMQIDNNLAFFKNADSNNPVLKEAYQKKEKVAGYIAEWKAKLSVLRGIMSEVKNAAQTSGEVNK